MNMSLLLGDNFFKPATYTIEALCAKSYEETNEKLKDIEAKLLAKRNDLRQFELEYRKVSKSALSSTKHSPSLFSGIYHSSILCDFIMAFQALVRFQEVTARYTEEKIDVS